MKPSPINPLDAVLSGKFELCVPHTREEGSFIRNASIRDKGGAWSGTLSYSVLKEDVSKIMNHPCVVGQTGGSMNHYGTRAFPLPTIKRPDSKTLNASSFKFSDIVVVDGGCIGCIVKSWYDQKVGSFSHEVYVRSTNGISEYPEEAIQRYIYSKEILPEELNLYKEV